MAIDESANLAQERGSYKNFVGSEWSKGKVPFDTIKKLEEERGVLVTVNKESRHKGLNWDLLRSKVKNGIRNATLMAVAPNANIGLVAGTTPGIDPRFAQVFSRNKISGKYVDINRNLVRDLKNMGIWDKVKDKIIESQGDIADIEEIPEYLKSLYKTSFTTSPIAYIEVAARAQKWIDQALSRNMYLETRDIDETMNIYKTAWEKGVKTTYYLHMKPRHTAEQSTVAVNKAVKIGKIGFGAISSLSSSPAFSMPLQKSLDMVVDNNDKVAEIKEEITVSEIKTEISDNSIKIEESVVSITEKVETKLENENKKMEILMESPISDIVQVKELVSVPSANNTTTVDAPEDPGDDANVCIACQ
jgi:ribonucleoside-diphosphate reductase alpha chain